MRNTTRILALAASMIPAALSADVVLAPADQRPITIAVAASAVPFVRAATTSVSSQDGPPVVISSGATGLLARQVREGAPFDIFVAADTDTLDKLVRDGFIETSSVACWGRGELLLWTPDPSKATSLTLARWPDWPAFVADAKSPAPDLRPPRFAIANPETAPFGAAARKALRDAGLWDALESRVIRMDDVGQAFQAARGGQVEAAFVPRSLLASAQPPATGRSIPVPGAIIPHALGIVAGAWTVNGDPNHSRSRTMVERLLVFARTEAARKLGYLPPEGP